MTRKHLTITVFLLLAGSTGPLNAQVFTKPGQYTACQDSLSREFSQAVARWNQAIPPHMRTAIRLEKEAEACPAETESGKAERDSLLSLAAKERQVADSLKPVLQADMDRIQGEKRELEKRYALVFEEAFPYFRMRKHYSKDSLALFLGRSSAGIRHSETGKALRKYLKHKQISKGERFKPFSCYDKDGKKFDWKVCRGRKVFLIHDGLWCMTHGTDNTLLRKYLDSITEASPECLPLIVVNCSTLEDLKASVEEYGLEDFLVVSELKGMLGKLNWLYDDSATPTCHYIDGAGILIHTSEGIDPEYLEKEFLYSPRAEK